MWTNARNCTWNLSVNLMYRMKMSALRIEELFGGTKTRRGWIAVMLPLGLSLAGGTAQHQR
jgi:hypothetical protein